ncbi:TPA: LamB/YcsF family protein [Klebsiella aerogenes]|nr:LamB/YcsF family protein [Klebsiella aerogenes]
MQIDLNSDLGEGFGAWRMGDDEAMLPLVCGSFAKSLPTEPRPNATLVSRSQPGAVIHSAQEVVSRITGLLQNGTLPAIDGSPLAVKADSICIHGDTPGSVEMAASVRRQLLDAGIMLAPAVNGGI